MKVAVTEKEVELELKSLGYTRKYTTTDPGMNDPVVKEIESLHANVRFRPPGWAGTCDFNTNRLNVNIVKNEETGDYYIQSVDFE